MTVILFLLSRKKVSLKCIKNIIIAIVVERNPTSAAFVFHNLSGYWFGKLIYSHQYSEEGQFKFLELNKGLN